MRRGTAEEKLMYAFDLYDTNKVGYLNRSQVEQVINNMLELLQEDKIQSKSKVCAQECIQLLAKSNHGRLYKKEFIQGLMKNPGLRGLLSPIIFNYFD